MLRLARPFAIILSWLGSKGCVSLVSAGLQLCTWYGSEVIGPYRYPRTMIMRPRMPGRTRLNMLDCTQTFLVGDARLAMQCTGCCVENASNASSLVTIGCKLCTWQACMVGKSCVPCSCAIDRSLAQTTRSDFNMIHPAHATQIGLPPARDGLVTM